MHAYAKVSRNYLVHKAHFYVYNLFFGYKIAFQVGWSVLLPHMFFKFKEI
jgi:hypothetical protein